MSSKNISRKALFADDELNAKGPQPWGSFGYLP